MHIPTERKRRWTRWVLVTALLSVGCFDLELDGDIEYVEGNDPRLLDRACDHDLCDLDGTARLTDGLTADSTGLKVGPDRGRAEIYLVREPSSTQGPNLAILAAGRGVVYVGDEPLELSDTYAWYDVKSSPTGSLDASIRLEVEIRDGNSEVEVVDVRSAIYDWTNHGCGTSSPGAQ
jgi:hypothetical protein